MTTADVLRGAIALLETRGRCRGLDVDSDGRICASEALCLATETISTNGFVTIAAARAVKKAFGGDSFSSLSGWNDATADDAVVLDAFRRALANEEAKEAKP